VVSAAPAEQRDAGHIGEAADRGEPVIRLPAMPTGDLHQPGHDHRQEQHQPGDRGGLQVDLGEALVTAGGQSLSPAAGLGGSVWGEGQPGPQGQLAILDPGVKGGPCPGATGKRGHDIRRWAGMSGLIPSHDVVVVREADAEVLASGPLTGLLYADSSATGGALSSQRIVLRHGAAGATPHHHTGSSELFYVVSGAAEMLTGERVVTVAEGDLAVVPPGTVHAFAAAPASNADLLIILAPGVERFEYFRQLRRIAAGEATIESILETQDLYDNHYDDSPVWQQVLAARS
jgi:mannose-6-phosphate isomerase-like protein (cupin superfamily)